MIKSRQKVEVCDRPSLEDRFDSRCHICNMPPFIKGWYEAFFRVVALPAEKGIFVVCTNCIPWGQEPIIPPSKPYSGPPRFFGFFGRYNFVIREITPQHEPGQRLFISELNYNIGLKEMAETCLAFGVQFAEERSGRFLGCDYTGEDDVGRPTISKKETPAKSKPVKRPAEVGLKQAVLF